MKDNNNTIRPQDIWQQIMSLGHYISYKVNSPFTSFVFFLTKKPNNKIISMMKEPSHECKSVGKKLQFLVLDWKPIVLLVTWFAN